MAIPFVMNDLQIHIDALFLSLQALAAAVAITRAESERPDNASVSRPALLTVDQAAERLSLGRTTTFGLVKDGRLRSVKISGARRVPIDAIAEFIASAESGAE